jgi:hypothetical protein
MGGDEPSPLQLCVPDCSLFGLSLEQKEKKEWGEQ